MDKEILKEFCKMQNRINELTQRIDNVANGRIDNITPYKEVKTAYIDDTEVVFESVPQGNLSVFVVDSENNYPAFTLERTANRLKVSFEPCKTLTTVTISIL